MQETKRDGRVISRRVSGTVLAVLTSKLVVDLLADQPRSIRLAGAVIWAVAFVCVWELLTKTMFARKSGGNRPAI